MSEAITRQHGEASHLNVGLINKLYTAIQKGDADAIASCYTPDAHFEDIAFRLDGRERIHDMWRMVCKAKPKVTFDSVVADDTKGSGHWTARYTFSETKRPVENDLTSEFVIENGYIRSHKDKCDAMKWAMQAYPFPKGLIAGLVAPLRRRAAHKKLDEFVKSQRA